jgi:hypothetical protein
MGVIANIAMPAKTPKAVLKVCLRISLQSNAIDIINYRSEEMAVKAANPRARGFGFMPDDRSKNR